MMLFRIVFEVFILYQITQVITESKLSKPFREYLNRQKYWVPRVLYELLSCFLCTSIWVGFILTHFLFDLASHLGYTQLSWFWNGLFFSSLAWFMRVWESSKNID